MRGLLAVLSVCVVLAAAGATGSSAESGASSRVTFRVVDIYIESSSALAAYQVEVNVERGEAAVVGVEGGEAPMDEPPFYDPTALEGGRIVLAAFDTERTLAAGRHRIASLHMRETGAEVRYAVVARVAADAAGVRQSARVFAEPRSEVRR